MSIDHDLEIDPAAPHAQPARAPRWAGPAAGLLAATTALAVGTLAASVLGAVTPMDAVGGEFIDRTPSWLKSFAIATFGTADKTALRVGMVLVIALLALVVGASARRRPAVGRLAFAGFAVFGAIVALRRPGEGVTAALPPLVAGAVGAVALTKLLAPLRAGDGPRDRPVRSRAPDGWDRRRFVVAAAGASGVAVVAATAVRAIGRAPFAESAGSPPSTLPPVAAGGDVALPGSTTVSVPAGATLSPVTPFITPNDDFYRIDTTLSVPRVDASSWSVEIGGMVERPLQLGYADLLARPQVERIITMACVSNEVGGDLVGTAVWQGVLLADLFEEAGVRPGAEQVFSRSVDGWTCGFPVAAASDGRDAMIALGMNGEPLPRRHGFPARLVIPGLYGYVSATKWLSSIELTTWDAAEGYWLPRGWAREAPVKTQSRIDVPRKGEEVEPGRTVVAGVAWAPRRGIARVEVRVDDGPWQQATLGETVGDDAWRQWRWEWDATPGDHRIQVRATDGTGAVQPQEVSRPDPDGATGRHTRAVSVSSR